MSCLPRKLINCFLPQRKVSACLRCHYTASFPGGEGEHAPGNELLVSCLPGKLIDCLLPLREGQCMPACELLPSLGGRWAPSCLPVWEETKLQEELSEDTPLIFPSFLFSKLLNLFICLCLTLGNLISPIFSTKAWHSLSLCVDKIDANCDLHSCLLPTLSRILFIALTLAWSKSFSAFLTIFFALSVFKVDFSLILTGIKSLHIHLKVKILWFLVRCPQPKSFPISKQVQCL